MGKPPGPPPSRGRKACCIVHAMTIPDPDPPEGVPLLEWGEPLPMDWQARDDGSMYILPSSHFLTRHGDTTIAWITDGSVGAEAFDAFHVPFPDGSRGQARWQRSSMGMVHMTRPWRRRRGNSWWPGDLVIKRDRVAWTDHAGLLDLWKPQGYEATRLFLMELGPGGVMPPGQFHWPHLYLALCEHPEFLEAVRDNDFASSANLFFCRRSIFREADGARMLVGSDRRYGDMLGAWRRCGESYLDFMDELPGEPREAHMPRLVGMLNAAGFRAQAH
ncbi:MAG TPA: hypothetical protein VGO52_25260 [Hyphomonadaceae bacterium]|nr:hypothetical protein [Hyphomonadaceae bacterium]